VASRNFNLGRRLGRLVRGLNDDGTIVSGSAIQSSVTTIAAAAGGSGTGVTTYSTFAELPLSDITTGAQAFVAESNRLYLWNGTGWYNIALINTAPTITSGGDASYSFATDGTPTVITLEASDPEGFPITWSYSVTSGSLGSTATVSQADNVFTITPSTNTENAGEFSITFTASDGVNLATAASSFTLIFSYGVEMYAWGGGGGGARGGTAQGGGGGAAYGMYNFVGGTTYEVVVGGAGTYVAPNAASPIPGPLGGGGAGAAIGHCGSGGGYSGIFLNSVNFGNAILIAGGGGGGGWAAAGAAGGAGGGTEGSGGTGPSAGSGGTQNAGGAGYNGGAKNGSALQGGTSGSDGDRGGGGGGGGGYYGGGAGDNGGNSGGGGGSGYYKPGDITSPTLYSGSGATPGNSSDPLRGSYGAGGPEFADGTQGVFIIRYAGAQRGTGGTITSSGGYTYHTFTSAGTYTA
jgi:hypothetical protein